VFVLIDAPSLRSFGCRGADSGTFSKHFRRNGDSTSIAFHNLGKDARLVAPRPTSDSNYFAHLASFLRESPWEEVGSLLSLVAREYLKRLHSVSPRPVWLSTSGLGVAWLHFRLDSTPKYYNCREVAKLPVVVGNNGKREGKKRGRHSSRK